MKAELREKIIDEIRLENRVRKSIKTTARGKKRKKKKKTLSELP